MNPFAYFILAGTVSYFVTEGIDRLFGHGSGDEGELNADHATWLMLIFLLPFAFLWSKLFRRAGLNLAENYVFGLYTLAQFTWIELLILTPVSYVIDEWWLVALYFVGWVAYVSFAAREFYGEAVVSASLKVAGSLAIIVALLFLTAIPAGLVMYLMAPAEPSV